MNTVAGSDAISSGTVHIDVRPAVAVRTRATSAAVTNPPVLPKLRRVNEDTAATHSSLLTPIGIITSVYVLLSIGPVRPCSMAFTM